MALDARKHRNPTEIDRRDRSIPPTRLGYPTLARNFISADLVY